MFQTLFDPFFISLYNVFYTSLPVLVLGIFDQVCFQDQIKMYVHFIIVCQDSAMDSIPEVADSIFLTSMALFLTKSYCIGTIYFSEFSDSCGVKICYKEGN